MALRRKGDFPQTCAERLARFLLEPRPSVATWSPAVQVASSGETAWCRWASSHGNLIFTGTPMSYCKEGRYAEFLVKRLSGNQQCGIVLGVTLQEPGTWSQVPHCIQSVPLCAWGLPRCRAPRFEVGTRIGYLVSWAGELVLFVNGGEVGRSTCPELSGSHDIWLVADLSHDVDMVAIVDEEPPRQVPAAWHRLGVCAKRCGPHSWKRVLPLATCRALAGARRGGALMSSFRTWFKAEP